MELLGLVTFEQERERHFCKCKKRNRCMKSNNVHKNSSVGSPKFDDSIQEIWQRKAIFDWDIRLYLKKNIAGNEGSRINESWKKKKQQPCLHHLNVKSKFTYFFPRQKIKQVQVGGKSAELATRANGSVFAECTRRPSVSTRQSNTTTEWKAESYLRSKLAVHGIIY